MKITALLIDDEKDSRIVTRMFIEKYCPHIFIAGEATSVEGGLTAIEQYQPDLLLLDIEMFGGSGFDLLNRVQHIAFEVIFLTAYQSYAIEAFKFSAVAYLLKPLSIADLQAAIKKATEKIEKKAAETQRLTTLPGLKLNNYERKLAIATTTGYVFVNVKDIVRCQSQGNYTEFYFTNNKKMLSSHNLGFFEDLLPAEKFCRIHHSYLINIDFIEKYNKGRNGGSVIMSDGTELDVSQRRKEDFLQYFLNK
jgi:two-component system LytT family response regulator